ncbi:ABC transporter ATP-binding protein [Bdellovibrio bacteriovorus]
MKVVEVANLSVKFGDYFAVNKISFSVGQGEIFGFLGANGAGKTTTIRVLCGLLLPSHGQAQVCGFDVLKDAAKVKNCVGYMSQKFTLYDDLTVKENLEFTGALRKLDPEKLQKQKEKLLNFIKFKGDENSLVKNLPGGIKQQVSLIASVLHNPSIVFLDEPTAGVSPAYRQRFWSLIRELAKEGKTVFVTTHYMDEAEQCERIALMRSGELIALDSPKNLKQQSFPDRDPRKVTLEEVFIHQVEGRLKFIRF